VDVGWGALKMRKGVTAMIKTGKEEDRGEKLRGLKRHCHLERKRRGRTEYH
jgi:hypothetical protein